MIGRATGVLCSSCKAQPVVERPQRASLIAMDARLVGEAECDLVGSLHTWPNRKVFLDVQPLQVQLSIFGLRRDASVEPRATIVIRPLNDSHESRVTVICDPGRQWMHYDAPARELLVLDRLKSIELQQKERADLDKLLQPYAFLRFSSSSEDTLRHVRDLIARALRFHFDELPWRPAAARACAEVSLLMLFPGDDTRVAAARPAAT
mmetsp:Transcript_75875/g.201592  ORF Transcript_75875/g.201592 Transcript_75875/m.201592 type:complete len:207 (+) Transcript_75875:842-1462(+)